MKVVLTGDLHLGRTSTRIPERWVEESRSLHAWSQLVDASVEAGVQAVLISGDLIDHANRFWETIGPFEQGVKTLSEAGIDVIAISGNHDATVLPSIAQTLIDTRFTLLGNQGTWERMTLRDNGTPALHVDGWSFPEETVYTDPSLSYSLPPPTDGIPVLGMVHGDPGVATSRYAPLNLSTLQSLPLSGWLLGHIHKPSFTEGHPWVLMPGTPHPLDPGETGNHHAWICEVQDGTLSKPEPFCPARLSYTPLVIPLPSDLAPSLEGIHRLLRNACDEAKLVGRHVLRIQLSGHTRDPELLQASIGQLNEGFEFENRVIERVTLDLQPEWELDTVRNAGPVPALLANAMEREHPELWDRLHAVVDQINRQSEYDGAGLSSVSLDELPVDRMLRDVMTEVVKEME